MSAPHNVNPLLTREAVIKKKVSETQDTYSITFSLVGDGDFSFVPGQFNMLGVAGFGEAPISFSSLPIGKKGFIHTIRLAGNVTKAICRIAKGGRVCLRGPYGNGWPLDKALGRHLVIVAGGIGMAPLRPVVQHLVRNRKKFAKLFLLYGARTEDDLLFREELKEWSQSKAISVFLSVDEAPKRKSAHIHQGVVTTLFDKVDVPFSEAVTFTCGPEIMMRFVGRQAILRGQSAHHIFVSLERRMKCGIGHCGHCQIGAKFVCKDGPVFAYDDIKRFADTLL